LVYPTANYVDKDASSMHNQDFLYEQAASTKNMLYPGTGGGFYVLCICGIPGV
jgi:hypothetical protein